MQSNRGTGERERKLGAEADLEEGRDGMRYIQIDCGKCFREQVLRWFIKHKVPTIHAVSAKKRNVHTWIAV